MRKLPPPLLLAMLFFIVGCPDNPTTSPARINTGIYAEQLGEIRRDATAAQRETFDRGREVALHRFSVDDGLGPQFNVSFCGACHEKPFLGGTSPRYRGFSIVGSRLSDGSVINTGINGVQTQFSIFSPHRTPSDPATNFSARRNAIPFFGVGALAAIDEASILANADPDDLDEDGISGRANYDDGFVGRFGRKSQTVSIEGFIRGPLFNHLGVTTEPLSEEKKLALPVPSPSSIADSMQRSPLPCFACQAAAPDEPNLDFDDAEDPEMTEDALFDLVSFAMLLGAPKPEPLDAAGLRGEQLFRDLDCAGCHVPFLDGPGGRVGVYSDLLLHDMGEDLADGVTPGVATGSEFRTQPLWGVVAAGPYLHDGRADSLHEAIQMHGGESKNSQEKYELLSETEREDLLHFLSLLGGREDENEGLINRHDRVPDVGETGGPIDSSDLELFARGRRVFDRDITLDAGLGSRFNGDSCRACHFDPQIGGSGPVGVNVVREGLLVDGEFTAPEDGTLLHRFALDASRPEPLETSNVFELRQTPAMFGLGLVDQIESGAILALSDPADLDGDGISGVARILDDGRLGKFGWKASLPSLEDFARDAISNEIGLTLASNAAFIAGTDRDADSVSDPELAQNDYEALIFFSKNLAPPKRGGVTAEVSRGAVLFSEVGCDGCHTASLPTESGLDVFLYSDLLLHDVQADDYRGIEDGSASPREFRTTPLWGVGDTGPYWHDGLSATIEAAIVRHEAEATNVIEIYQALSETDAELILRFLESL